jgi:signal transduction histidine kinase
MSTMPNDTISGTERILGFRQTSIPQSVNSHLLLTYVADLELEIDRLRKHGQFLQFQVADCVKRIQAACSASNTASNGMPATEEITQVTDHLVTLLRELRELPAYDPAHDQVIAIAIRPLMQLLFRWQQRLENAPNVGLRLELECDHVSWFPARLRHVLDTLFASVLKYRDPGKAESWVRCALRANDRGYELTVSDNGSGIPARELSGLAGILYRAAPVRTAGLSVGMAVVKLLVEQSGGTLTVESVEGQGTTIVVFLPRYEIDDFLT